MRWIEGLVDGVLDVFLERRCSIDCDFSITNDFFAKILYLVCAINGNIFDGLGSRFSSVFDWIGDISNKIELREDGSEEEWDKNEEFHLIV